MSIPDTKVGAMGVQFRLVSLYFVHTLSLGTAYISGTNGIPSSDFIITLSINLEYL